MPDETPIKIIRSPNRRRTVSAKMVDGVMEVRAPERISERELNETIQNFKKRFHLEEVRKNLNQKQNLWPIAERLNKQYFDGKLKFRSIEYVTNHTSMYGSCDIREKEIRISHELSKMPNWVRDYVIVHELAHLIEANHNKRFWKLVNRYPLTERARGFLLAKGLDESDTVDEESDPDDISGTITEKLSQTQFNFE